MWGGGGCAQLVTSLFVNWQQILIRRKHTDIVVLDFSILNFKNTELRGPRLITGHK